MCIIPVVKPVLYFIGIFKSGWTWGMEQPLKQTMILFSLAESYFSGGKRRKREGKENNAAAFLAGTWDGVVGSPERCSCQHIHMSSLFRHTLENVTSFQAWPGKGSTEEGGKAPDCCQPAPESCLPLCACMHMWAYCMTHFMDGMCAFACGFAD